MCFQKGILYQTRRENFTIQLDLIYTFFSTISTEYEFGDQYGHGELGDDIP